MAVGATDAYARSKQRRKRNNGTLGNSMERKGIGPFRSVLLVVNIVDVVYIVQQLYTTLFPMLQQYLLIIFLLPRLERRRPAATVDRKISLLIKVRRLVDL